MTVREPAVRAPTRVAGYAPARLRRDRRRSHGGVGGARRCGGLAAVAGPALPVGVRRGARCDARRLCPVGAGGAVLGQPLVSARDERAADQLHHGARHGGGDRRVDAVRPRVASSGARAGTAGRGSERRGAARLAGRAPIRVRRAYRPTRVAGRGPGGQLGRRSGGRVHLGRRRTAVRGGVDPGADAPRGRVERGDRGDVRRPGAAGASQPRGLRGTAAPHRAGVAALGGRAHVPPAVAGRRDAQCARPQAVGVRAVGRPRGRGHDLPSGADARAPQLGLPLLLDPDSAFTLDAFLQLDCVDEPVGFFWWMMHASQLTHPRLRVLYALDGGAQPPEKTLPLHGYRGSAPVRVGNAAIDQVQLDTYGELMQTAWLYATGGHPLDRDVAGRLAEIADHVCRTWRQPDAGIWEVRSAPEQFTQSKMMCWVALDRALDLAERGLVPGRHAARWRRERDTIAEYVETRCFNPDLNSYVRAADGTDLDASLLLGVLHGYRPSDPGRFDGMIDAVQRLLRRGPYVYRYVSPDGLPHEDGAFLACSFWLAEALARRGRVAEAVPLMDRLVALANDVGLYSEEIVPETGEFLGNLPQGLSHLALVSAACAIAEATS